MRNEFWKVVSWNSRANGLASIRCIPVMTSLILVSDCIFGLDWIVESRKSYMRRLIILHSIQMSRSEKIYIGVLLQKIAMLFCLINLQCFYWSTPVKKRPDVQSRHHWPGRHCGKTELTNKEPGIQADMHKLTGCLKCSSTASLFASL